MTTVVPDSVIPIRNYLRAVSAVTALVPVRRIDLGLVAGDGAQIVVRRIGGGEDSSEAPVDVALLQIDVWGDTNGSLEDCATIKSTVRGALLDIRSPVTAGGAKIHSASTIDDNWAPDPDTDQPRFVLTVRVVVGPTS